jgi:hypothetical protein
MGYAAGDFNARVEIERNTKEIFLRSVPRNLFLDDERRPEDVTWIDIGLGPWTIVRTQEEFEDYILTNGIPDKISFDNDLGDGNGEGRYCVQWLIDNILDGHVTFRPFVYIVHSKNNVAAEAISMKLEPFFNFMKNQNQISARERTKCPN